MLLADGAEEVDVVSDVASVLDANVAHAQFATVAEIRLRLVAVIAASRTAVHRLLQLNKKKEKKEKNKLTNKYYCLINSFF